MPTHIYGNGTNSTSGANTQTHFYDVAGIKAANRVNIFQQFADKRSMPLRTGKTFKISKFFHMYDRAPDSAEFAARGYLSSRSVTEVTASLSGSLLTEGAGAVNKRELRKLTMETTLSRHGEMIDYTDEVDLFSEDIMQTRYREELGYLANSRMEDLIMRDMLATPTVMFSGLATDNDEIGDGALASGADDADWKVSYDLIRKVTAKLQRNRAKMNTAMVKGDRRIDTQTVNRAYYGIVTPEVRYDLETLTRGTEHSTEYVFIPVHKYAAAGNLAEGEIGQVQQCRFIESEGLAVYRGATGGAVPPQNYVGTLAVSNEDPITGEPLPVDLTSADAGDRGHFEVHPIIFPTEGSFACVGLKGRDKIVFHAAAPSKVDNTNPYGTKGFFSYNFFYGGIILEEEKLLKVLVAASA